MLLSGVQPDLRRMLLIINRKGECRMIESSSGVSVERPLVTIFSEEKATVIQKLTREVLNEQTPKPLSICLSGAGEETQCFSYLFPLSLASVLFMAQPLENFSGKAKQSAIELFPLPTFLYDQKTGNLTAVNQVAIRQYGYTKGEFLDKKVSELHPSQKLPLALTNVSQLVTGEWPNYCKDGKLIYVVTSACPINHLEENKVLLLSQDITEYRYTKTAVEEQQPPLTELTQKFPPCGVLGFQVEGYYTLAVGTVLNSLIETTMATEKETIEGKSLEEVFCSQFRQILQPIQEKILSGYLVAEEISYYQRSYYAQGYPIRNSQGMITGGVLILQNLTPRRQLQALLTKHAFYDATTNLPNKSWLLEQISTQISVAVGQPLAVILVKLERYGIIKYGLGHQLAEKLIITVAKRLKEGLNLSYDFARVGDGAIAIFLPDLSQKEAIEKLAQSIHNQLNLALEVDDQELFCPVSVGVAVYNGSLEDSNSLKEPSALLHAADTAMNAARGEATLPCVIFHPYLYQPAATRVQLETELRRALRLKQLDVFYQPTVTIADGKLSGFEALVRWQHPKKGLVSPGKFMPLAQELGLIGLIDWWVLAEACEKLAIWQKMIPEGEFLSMNVNLSENMINQVGILERLDNIIKRSAIAPMSLKLEVTEDMILEGKTATTGILKQLQQMGLSLSIDDFGTGHSCLRRLHQLPIDTLKIDRSFTRRMLKDEEILQIVKTIINLAHDLNMEVIAEGIETEEQWEIFKSLNCEYGQGFLFGKPLPAQEIGELIAAHR